MKRGLAITLLAVLIAWGIAQWALQSYLIAQGTRDLQRVALDLSQSSFEFDQIRDLIGADVDRRAVAARRKRGFATEAR